MDIFLVSGFLGAGKTTFIKHLLTSELQGLGKVALIVNEVGDIGIDGTILSGQNVDMIEIASGCICCTLKTDFTNAVEEIYHRVHPDFLVVEATGVAQPGDILDAVYETPAKRYSRLRHLVTVVDTDFFKAREVLGPFYNNQISCADTILLNKTDLVSPDLLREIQDLVRKINPDARVFMTQLCAVDLHDLLTVSLYEGNEQQPEDRKLLHHQHDHPDEGGFQAFSFEGKHPFDKEKLKEFLQTLPPTLFRLKGWVRFADADALLSFTAGHYSLMPANEVKKTALAFVGYNCNENEILNALTACLIEPSAKPGMSDNF
ncbi:MAG: CobW family GTP-binding protein [Desulfobacterales bacterium]